MATTKVKNLKKTDWQEIAKSHNIDFTNDNEVRYLVEKIAEKIGVDDKIVKLDDLKQAVYDKLNSQPEGNDVKVETESNQTEVKVEKAKKPANEKKSTSKTTKTGKKKTTKTEEEVKEVNEVAPIKIDPEEELLHYRKEAQRLGVNYGVEQGVNEIKQFLDYFCKVNPPVTYVTYEETLGISPEVENTPSTPVNRLEELRAECRLYGVAYGEAHKESDLEQLLSMIRGVVQPIAPTNAPEGDFELKVDNFDEISKVAPTTTTTNPVSGNNNVMQVITAKSPAPSPIGMNELNTYRTVFNQTIRNHWRLLSENEIKEMFTRDRYPFNFEIKKNPNQHNQIEIILSLAGNSVRVPSEDKNEWLSING